MSHVVQCIFIAVSNIVTIYCSLLTLNSSKSIKAKRLAVILLFIGVSLMILDVVLIVALILGWW